MPYCWGCGHEDCRDPGHEAFQQLPLAFVPRERPVSRLMRVLRGEGSRPQLEKVCNAAMQAGCTFAVPSALQWELAEWPNMKFVITGDLEAIGQLEEDPDVRPYLWDLEE